MPEFLFPLENHTVIQGRDVVFTCVVNHLQNYKVCNILILIPNLYNNDGFALIEMNI